MNTLLKVSFAAVATQAVSLTTSSTVFNTAAAGAKEFLDEDRQEFFASDSVEAYLSDMEGFYATARQLDLDYQGVMEQAAANAAAALELAAQNRDAGWMNFEHIVQEEFKGLVPDVIYHEATTYSPGADKAK